MADQRFQHVMAVKGTEFYVVGQSVPIDGRGGGQFINHTDDPQHANVKIVVIMRPRREEIWQYLLQPPMQPPPPVLAVVALKDIAAGTELLWTYPLNTVKRMGLDPAARTESIDEPDAPSTWSSSPPRSKDDM